MSYLVEPRDRIQLPDLIRRKTAGQPLVMVTAYDAPTAHIADAAGVDMILVGDSVGNVCLGFENTLPVSMAMMRHHLEAVMRAKPSAFVVADMPYLSYHVSLEESIRNAGFLAKAGAQGVKLEGGAKRLNVVNALVDAEIPVMGHLGLTPQSVHAMGGYRVQGRSGEGAITLLEDAKRLQDAGCFALLLEGIPAPVAARITRELDIPTIGIGAGVQCSGQVLVFHDVLGILNDDPPRFVRKYLNGFDDMTRALTAWAQDVRSGEFPGMAESYALPESELKILDAYSSTADGFSSTIEPLP